MDARGIVVGLLAGVALAGCGGQTAGSTGGEPFALPVGPTTWDADAPAWFYDGTLHVGKRTVELAPDPDLFVLGPTGAYWTHGGTLMFTSADGATQEVAEVGWSNVAMSADRSVFATVDQSRGPTDKYGTHVIQLAVFDTRTGDQIYRTPDEEPSDGADLADLYGEIMPLLRGVSDERAFYDGTTITLADGSVTPAGQDADGIEVYDGLADTLFLDGYHVSIEGQGRHRALAESTLFGTGLLSPDRSTIFDVSMWPTPAVVYDAATGRQRPIGAPWRHFSLAGWSDEDTFFGVAEQIDEKNLDNVLRARQIVTCELRTLRCTPVSRVMPTDDDLDEPAPFLIEGSSLLY